MDITCRGRHGNNVLFFRISFFEVQACHCHTRARNVCRRFNHEENAVTGMISYHRGIKPHHSNVTCVQSTHTQPSDSELYFARQGINFENLSYFPCQSEGRIYRSDRHFYMVIRLGIYLPSYTDRCLWYRSCWLMYIITCIQDKWCKM